MRKMALAIPWRISIVIVLILSAFVIGLGFGYSRGKEDGARQMARHISNPSFTTPDFDQIVKEETK